MLRLFIYQDSLNEPQNTRKTRKGFMNQNYLSAFLWLFSVTLCDVLFTILIPARYLLEIGRAHV